MILPPSEPPQERERLTCGPEEAGQMLGISKPSVYALLKTGRLKSVRLGRKFLIPLSAVAEFLNSRQANP